MAKTLLNGVNELLTKTSAIDSGTTLNSLTDASRQTFIDLAVQVFNEVIDELYSVGERSKPKQMKERTITLVSGQRSYVLAADLVTLRSEYPLTSEADNKHIIILGEDGYRQIVTGDIEQDDTGQPVYCAINPVNGRLVMDVIPTSVEDGQVFKYRYDRDLELDAASDSMPFSNAVYRAVLSAAAELWKLHRHQDFNEGLFRLSLGRAGRLLRQQPASGSWMPRRPGINTTDPLE
jgi:hypothetical protein